MGSWTVTGLAVGIARSGDLFHLHLPYSACPRRLNHSAASPRLTFVMVCPPGGGKEKERLRSRRMGPCLPEDYAYH